MLTYFLMATIACPLMFAMFFGDLAEMIHAPLSRSAALYIGVFVATVPVAASCLRGAEASTKVTVRLMLADTLVVMALSVTILIAKWGHLSKVALAPFNPGNATQGFSGFWAAMIVGVLGFCGFDVVSTAAEEAGSSQNAGAAGHLYHAGGYGVVLGSECVGLHFRHLSEERRCIYPGRDIGR